MKNEKFCFNKGVGLIALIGIVLVGFVLASQTLTSTKTSTNSRASAPAVVSCGGDWQTPCANNTCTGERFLYQKSKDTQAWCIPNDAYKNSYADSLRDSVKYIVESEGKFLVGTAGNPCYPNKGIALTGGSCNTGFICKDFTSADAATHLALRDEGDIFQPLLSSLPYPYYERAFPNLSSQFKNIGSKTQYAGGICVSEQKECGGEGQSPCPVTYGSEKDCTFPNSQLVYIKGNVLNPAQPAPSYSEYKPIVKGEYLGCSTKSDDLAVNIITQSGSNPNISETTPVSQSSNIAIRKSGTQDQINIDIQNPMYSVAPLPGSASGFDYAWIIECRDGLNATSTTLEGIPTFNKRILNFDLVGMCNLNKSSLYSITIKSFSTQYNTSKYKKDELNTSKPVLKQVEKNFQFTFKWL